MKPFSWNADKNRWLKRERRVSFEQIVLAIENDCLITVVDHPDQSKYPGQKIAVVEINDYAYAVLYIETEERLFLKTIFPSRKYTRLYLKEG
jgi:hypothetical protein